MTLKGESNETAFTEPVVEPVTTNMPASPVVNAMRRLVDRLSKIYFFLFTFEIFFPILF